jgi:hypothetical protein
MSLILTLLQLTTLGSYDPEFKEAIKKEKPKNLPRQTKNTLNDDNIKSFTSNNESDGNVAFKGYAKTWKLLA